MRPVIITLLFYLSATMGLASIFKIGPSGNKSGNTLPIGEDASTENQPPSRRQIFQSRFNHGPNIGAWFVAEKWISNELFPPNAANSSELDAVTAAVNNGGINAANAKWLSHYQSWMTDNDWNWLKSKGVNSIRVPIGYWLVNDGQFTRGTPFEKYAGVYRGGWQLFKSLALDRAAELDISVLVDFHALPGGANTNDHSGTSSGVAGLWTSRYNQDLAIKALQYLAKDLAGYDNICAIGLVNEAAYADENNAQETFYINAANAIRAVTQDIPLVISDAWDPVKWTNFVANSITSDRKSPQVIVDSHIYRCFAPDDTSKPAAELMSSIASAFDQDNKLADVMVGEYSCVLSETSWGAGDRLTGVRQYGKVESDTFAAKARAGNYFWTYKFQGCAGEEWDFTKMVNEGALPTYSTSSFDKPDADSEEEYQSRLSSSTTAHENYWRKQNSSLDWQFWRFQNGFWFGWHDTLNFAKFNNSDIGRLAAWKLSREAQHVRKHGDNNMVWQFNHGFDQGRAQFLNYAGR